MSSWVKRATNNVRKNEKNDTNDAHLTIFYLDDRRDLLVNQIQEMRRRCEKMRK